MNHYMGLYYYHCNELPLDVFDNFVSSQAVNGLNRIHKTLCDVTRLTNTRTTNVEHRGVRFCCTDAFHRAPGDAIQTRYYICPIQQSPLAISYYASLGLQNVSVRSWLRLRGMSEGFCSWVVELGAAC